jgi:hypothetical protein
MEPFKVELNKLGVEFQELPRGILSIHLHDNYLERKFFDVHNGRHLCAFFCPNGGSLIDLFQTTAEKRRGKLNYASILNSLIDPLRGSMFVGSAGGLFFLKKCDSGIVPHLSRAFLIRDVTAYCTISPDYRV